MKFQWQQLENFEPPTRWHHTWMVLDLYFNHIYLKFRSGFRHYMIIFEIEGDLTIKSTLNAFELLMDMKMLKAAAPISSCVRFCTGTKKMLYLRSIAKLTSVWHGCYFPLPHIIIIAESNSSLFGSYFRLQYKNIQVKLMCLVEAKV